MKRTNSPFYVRRTFVLSLLSFVAVAALVSFGVSARRANRAAALQANSKAAAKPVSSAQDKNPNAPELASVTATLTDNTAVAVAPGGTINYTAVITNNGAVSPADDAGSVVYNGTLDANTTLSGLVGVSPVPVNDTFPVTVTGNVQINSANLAAPFSVIANDYQGQNGGAVSIGTSGSTLGGGQIVMNNTPGPNFGQFTYNPPAGFEGNDTFTYTLTNSIGSTTAATVTIPVSGMIWFIQNGAAACTTIAANCGRLTNPFSSLPAFQALNNGGVGSTNPAVGDNIFIYEHATDYTGGVTLLSNQKIIGQDSTDTLQTISGITPVTGSNPLPAMNTGAPATTLSGNGITLNALNTTNVIRGMTITNTVANTKINGTSFGTLTVGKSGSPDVILSGTGKALNLTTGTFAATSAFTSVAATSSATQGISLTSIAGTVSLGSTTTGATTNQGIFVNTSSVNITFGNTTVTTSGGTGVNLTANTGPFTFSDLDINPNAGQRGLHATTNTNTITSSSGTISTTTGTGVEIVGTSNASRTPLSMTLTSVSTNGAGNGIVLSNVNGPGASIGFSLIGDNANVTRGGNASGGTIASTVGATGASAGIGVRLENADEIALRRLQINDHPNFAVYANNASNVTLAFTTISGTNGSADGIAGTFFTDEAAVLFANMSGTGLVDRCTISGGVENNMTVVNDTGTLNRLVIDDTGFGLNGNALGADSLLIVASGLAANPASTVNVTIEDSDFLGARGDVVQTDFRENGKLDLIMERNDISNTHGNIVSAGGGCTFAGNGNALTGGVSNFTYNIGGVAGNGNTFRDAVGTGVALDMGTGKTEGRFRNNSIGVAAVANSASTQAGAFAYIVDPGGNNTVSITTNTIRQYNNHGILLQVGDIMGLATTVNMTVTGNSVNTPGNLLNDFNAIHLNHGTVGTDNMTSCVDIGGAAGLANSVANGGDGAIVPNSNDIRLRQRQATTVRLPGYGGANNDNTAVQNYLLARNTTQAQPLGTAASNTVPTGGGYIGGAACTQPANPSFMSGPADEVALNTPATQNDEQRLIASTTRAQQATVAQMFPAMATVDRIVNDQATQVNGARRAHHVQFNRSRSTKAVRADDQPLVPTSGEAVGPINIGTLQAGMSVTITYAATVNTPPTARQAMHQGTVTFAGGPVGSSPLATNDPDTGPAGDATVTQFNVLMTWNGSTSTDWNLATNWTQPVGGTPYAPGVSNPAINDVVIPAVATQPTISASDIGVYSLSLANLMTLTIDPARTLTVGGLPGGDLTLNGIISGGHLRFGSGTHAFNNAGGTGSLSSTNLMSVISGSTVTLNHDLQAGRLQVDSGGSMNITGRTLRLNGTGAALASPIGALNTATSTVILNGTAAQTIAGITYNNLTINNTIAPSPAHITGVTLTGNATVNGALTLTSSDLATTSGFTLTMPAAATSGPASGATDVVGNVKRTGFVAGGTALSFGNPFNTIRINSGAVPTDINVLIAKNPPLTYAGAVQRSYTITPNGANGPATLRLHYRQVELNGNSESPTGNFNFRKGPGWSAVIPTNRSVGVVEDNWLENNAVTDFSEWTFANLVPTSADGTVTGRIVDGNGAPVEGAVVMLTGEQNRKFITDANGVYRFDNVETNGFYNVTPSRVNYNFSPAMISFSQLGETTEASFGATATGGDINPLDTPEYFVRQNYLDFLGREPDEAGFNFWSDQILSCGGDTDCVDRKRTHVSAAYFFSIEFQATGGLVDGLYRVSYGVRPTFAEFRPDAAAVAPGLVVGNAGWEAALANGKTAFVEAFVQRAAFQATYGSLSNEAYVDALIANTGVSFTSAERSALVSGLGTSGEVAMTRAQVLRAIAENPNVVAAKRNEAFVMMEYFGYLRREPDAGGYLFWLTKLNNFNGNFEQAEMVRSFILSGEYRDRFPR